jgi:hypothetical protein
MSTNGHLARSSLLDDSLSPALARTHHGPAYEIKFLLSRDQAAEVEHRLLAFLAPDPHSDPALGGMYEIQSLACDDAGLGVFFREDRTRNRKYRVRRYGRSPVVYLERKRSIKSKVRKHRVQAPIEHLGQIGNGTATEPSHTWFTRALHAADLAPVCRIRCLRRALFGTSSENPMRVTFDRDIRGSLAPHWTFDCDGHERPLLDNVIVCEFKFRSAMPAPLKAVVSAMNLEPTGISKYRTCIRVFAKELGITQPGDPRPAA